ncbi:unnamed protein product [Dibothriocephalus latus]|uniref:Uncharacterized protein n=1 Tax=Dibothriocephalus latus TaxID=60516 RepID=A0A3P7LHN2_DIBLA|nr:unnamed protein product [Dibothriocephalus latus]
MRNLTASSLPDHRSWCGSTIKFHLTFVPVTPCSAVSNVLDALGAQTSLRGASSFIVYSQTNETLGQLRSRLLMLRLRQLGVPLTAELRDSDSSADQSRDFPFLSRLRLDISHPDSQCNAAPNHMALISYFMQIVRKVEASPSSEYRLVGRLCTVDASPVLPQQQQQQQKPIAFSGLPVYGPDPAPMDYFINTEQSTYQRHRTDSTGHPELASEEFRTNTLVATPLQVANQRKRSSSFKTHQSPSLSPIGQLRRSASAKKLTVAPAPQLDTHGQLYDGEDGFQPEANLPGCLISEDQTYVRLLFDIGNMALLANHKPLRDGIIDVLFSLPSGPDYMKQLLETCTSCDKCEASGDPLPPPAPQNTRLHEILKTPLADALPLSALSHENVNQAEFVGPTQVLYALQVEALSFSLSFAVHCRFPLDLAYLRLLYDSPCTAISILLLGSSTSIPRSLLPTTPW